MDLPDVETAPVDCKDPMIVNGDTDAGCEKVQ